MVKVMKDMWDMGEPFVGGVHTSWVLLNDVMFMSLWGFEGFSLLFVCVF